MKKHRKLLTFGVVICLVAGLVAGIFYYKQAEEERRLSLIYICLLYTSDAADE